MPSATTTARANSLSTSRAVASALGKVHAASGRPPRSIAKSRTSALRQPPLQNAKQAIRVGDRNATGFGLAQGTPPAPPFRARSKALAHIDRGLDDAHDDVHRRQPLGQTERFANRPFRPIAVHRSAQHLLADDKPKPRRILPSGTRRRPKRRHGDAQARLRKHRVEVAMAQQSPAAVQTMWVNFGCGHEGKKQKRRGRGGISGREQPTLGRPVFRLDLATPPVACAPWRAGHSTPCGRCEWPSALESRGSASA